MRLRDRVRSAAVHITTVITRNNLTEMPAFVRSMAAHGISVQFSPYHHFDTRVPDEETPRDPVVVGEVMQELLAMQAAGDPIANSRAYLEHFSSFFQQPRALPDWYRCYAAYVGVFADAALDVRPCWSWSLPVIGNLRRDRLGELWTSPQFTQQRARIRRLDCSRCWLLCTAELSIRFLEMGA
jgi:MoaA/NifB/PqqE/SkfB family radical SAM enzyme